MQEDEAYDWAKDAHQSYDLAIAELKKKFDAIPKVEIGNCVLYNAPCEEVMPLLDRVEAIVTDPPYGLSFMGKAWDYDVPKKETWELAYKLLSPGGHLLSFFGSRTYHRGAVQIEDAGFEIRDQIMWIYGSGFPKSHDVSKAIDKHYGEKRKIIGPNKFENLNGKNNLNCYGKASRPSETIPSNIYAQKWHGWGTALKPAHEPIVVARKPLNGTVAENVLNYGCGALNIDGCRIHSDDAKGYSYKVKRTVPGADQIKTGKTKLDDVYFEGQTKDGRWPANIIHDGSDEVVELFPNTKSGDWKGQQTGKGSKHSGDWGKKDREFYHKGDSGSAARFFYCAKASKADRDLENIHPTVKPTQLMRYLCRLVTPPNGTVLDPFMGSGSTGKAAVLEGFRFIGIEMNKEYFDIAVRRIRAAYESKNKDLFQEAGQSLGR